MNEKQQKWLPIFICLTFIFAWQYLVIAPAEKKRRAQESSVQESTKKNEGESNSNSVLVPTNKAQATLGTSIKIPEDFKKNPAVLNLKSSLRIVNIYGNGFIGGATFQDYKTRNKKISEPIVLLKEGYGWTSSDPKISLCLNRIKEVKREEGTAVSFSYAEGNEKCVLSYVRNPNHSGLVSAKLSFSGFNVQQGFLELRGADTLGTGPDTDHNYLGMKLDSSTSNVRENSLNKIEVRTGKVDWLVWGDKYFASILIPKGMFNPNIVFGPSSENLKLSSFGFQYPLVLKPDSPSDYEVDFYFGTRDGAELTKISPSLAETVDLGYFRSVALAMLWALKALYKIFQNYGLAIIMLTLLVRVLFWPLNKKVFHSGQKMKALQPKIEQLKAKYGGDKSQAEQMNKELMGLYKTHKVNPLGSCLPLLLQMPIFLGLYGALNHSLDLYQAPFFAWILDLSSPDPFFVFPILWTLTLLAYMKLNPTPTQAGAPDMRWMMIGMNLFFGYLSRNWPAGLTLYLFVSNLVGITQQFLFQRAAKLQPILEGV